MQELRNLEKYVFVTHTRLRVTHNTPFWLSDLSGYGWHGTLWRRHVAAHWWSHTHNPHGVVDGAPTKISTINKSLHHVSSPHQSSDLYLSLSHSLSLSKWTLLYFEHSLSFWCSSSTHWVCKTRFKGEFMVPHLQLFKYLQGGIKVIILHYFHNIPNS